MEHGTSLREDALFLLTDTIQTFGAIYISLHFCKSCL